MTLSNQDKVQPKNLQLKNFVRLKLNEKRIIIEISLFIFILH